MRYKNKFLITILTFVCLCFFVFLAARVLIIKNIDNMIFISDSSNAALLTTDIDTDTNTNTVYYYIEAVATSKAKGFSFTFAFPTTKEFYDMCDVGTTLINATPDTTYTVKAVDKFMK